MTTNRRPSAQRLSELIDSINQPGRKSRLDAPKRSFIPRPGSKGGGGSVDRVSGVHPLDGFCLPPHQSSAKGYSSASYSASRHRSADSWRTTFSHQRPRAESAQGSNGQSRSRSTYAMVRDTPVQKTPTSRTTMMQTPMSCMSIQSAGRRTPSAERKSRYAILHKSSQAIPGKDKRILSNVDWQKRTCERVVNRMRSDPVASLLIGQGPAPLKPVTIRLFVDLVNYCIDLPRCHVTMGNYVEKLPTIARKLLYPGTMTKSWLKSVNAMHTYPHMLAFLSYLVDFTDVKEHIMHSIDVEKLYGNSERGQVAMLQHEYFHNCWSVFQVSEDYEQKNIEYITELKKLRGISDDDVRQFSKDIEDLRLEVNGPNMVERRREEQEMHNQATGLEEENRALKQRDHDLQLKIKRVKSCLAAEEANLDKAKETMHLLDEEYKNLQNRLASQRMTVKEREQIITQTEQIVAAVDSKRELLDDLQKMSYKKDIEMAKVQKIALTASNNFNRSLISVGLAVGENLSTYSLEERELLAGQTPKNISEVRENLIRIKSKAEERLQAARHNKDEGACQRQQIKLNIESEQDRLKTLRAENALLEQKSEETRRRLSAEMNCLRATAQSYREKANSLREKAAQELQQSQKELDYWKDQDSKWRSKIDQLVGEGPLVREMCNKRAQSLITEYIKHGKILLDL